MIDNKSNYLIKTKKDKKEEKKDKFIMKEVDEQEIFNLLKSTALLMGLNNCTKDIKIRPISDWKFPKNFFISEKKIKQIRNHFQIDITGDDLLPPISNFQSMKFPHPILKSLEKLGVIHPSPIQMQGLPIV